MGAGGGGGGGGPGSFHEANFLRWIDLRMGLHGRPVFWYAAGEVHAFPSGRLLARAECLEVCRGARLGARAARQLSRRLLLFRDAASEEVLEEFNGQPTRPLAYPFQQTSFTLDDSGTLRTEATCLRDGCVSVLKGNVMSARELHGTSKTAFTCPIFVSIQTPKGCFEAYENYDYFSDAAGGPGGGPDGAPHFSMVRVGTTPPFDDRAVLHLVGWRADSFDRLPERIREFVGSLDPTWQEPPSEPH